MSLARKVGCIACVLLFSSIVQAGVVSVSQTLDYEDNGPWDVGPYFITPGDILDHPPHYRGVDEDWGWLHDMTALVPTNATGIQSATIAIEAWDVDYISNNGVNRVYANDVYLGILEDTNGRNFLYTYFELPSEVLAELWSEGTVFIFLEIDHYRIGERVAIRQATLTVDYQVPGTTPNPDPTIPIYRFWSEKLTSHFYTANETEKDKLLYEYYKTWRYENIAYRALVDDTKLNAFPIYRFWSEVLGGHFYTINKTEKDKLIRDYSRVWTFEGEAFYAFPEALAPADTIPVYRFWSERLGHHFYTSDEAEKQKLIDTYSYTWTFEGVAWYAYEP